MMHGFVSVNDVKKKKTGTEWPSKALFELTSTPQLSALPFRTQFGI